MKHNYKRHLSLVLAAALSLSLTACGPKNPSAQNGSASASQSMENPTGSVSVPDHSVPDPVPVDDSLTQLRVEMEPSAAIAGVFFLGVHEGEPLDEAFFADEGRQDYWKEYPFMKEIPQERYAKTAGTEVYCIVPADPKASVTVTEWDEAGEKPVEGKVLYESESGEPFFIQCNASDIMPNLSITITDGYGNVLDSYHPSISLKDGTVTLSAEDQPVVLDLTSYPVG